MLEVIYRQTRARVCDLAVSLTSDQLRASVAATPKWTVHEVLAHLVGCAADAASGRLDGVTSDAWTARHVAERRSLPVCELLAEWDQVGRVAGSALTDEQIYGPNLAADVICHEADLREALGLPRVSREHWEPFLEVMMLYLRSQRRYTRTLVISDEQGRQWVCGSGEPTTALCADGYELLRAMFSRRSRRQIAGWNWTSAPDSKLIECFGFFGSRDDDQPVPVA
ncbi:hypothetical protein BH09ACT8_BH09ACT8_20850 [soil metagenome]